MYLLGLVYVMGGCNLLKSTVNDSVYEISDYVLICNWIL